VRSWAFFSPMIRVELHLLLVVETMGRRMLIHFELICMNRPRWLLGSFLLNFGMDLLVGEESA
jgi:hypothetical protein